MNIRTDSVFKCIKAYGGQNSKGKPFALKKGTEYCKTQVDMSTVDQSRDDVIVFLNEWNTPNMRQLPSLSLDEFNKLENIHLEKVMTLN